MKKYIALALGLALATPAFAHSDSKFTKGPNGGHLVDAGGGKQHWELVAQGGNLTLFVTDSNEKPMSISTGSAEAQVLVGGKSYTVAMSPTGGHALKGTGQFSAAKGMRVIVKTSKVGGESLQARLTPLQ